MAKNLFKSMTLVRLIFTRQSWSAALLAFSVLGSSSHGFASSDICGRETFTHEELSKPYGAIRKSLRKYSRSESERMAEAIVRGATEEKFSYRRPCLASTKACVGHDKAWNYSKEVIVDNFGNPLRSTGEIVSRQYSEWPAGRYYSHQTQVGHSCAWGGGLQPQCEKWCSLVVVDDRFHD